MGRFLALVFLVFSSCLSCMGVKSPKIQVSKIEVMAQETVALVQYVNDGGDSIAPVAGATRAAYCAGTWVSPDTVLTAYHCVEDLATDPIGAEVLLAAKDDPGFFRGEVTKTDAVDDLALITSTHHPAHFYAHLARSAYQGDGLHILGHPAHKVWTYMHGYIAQTRDDMPSPNVEGKTLKVWQVSAPIYFGNSGGPAFNDAGEIVGVCSMLSTRVPNMGYFVHLDTIRAFLRD